MRAVDGVGRRIGLYVEFVLSPLCSRLSIWSRLVLPSLRSHTKAGADSDVSVETQILRATTPSQAREQPMMLLLLIRQHRLRRRRCHWIRTRTATPSAPRYQAAI